MIKNLDKLDQKLILSLQEDGRHSYMDLARMLGVTEGTIRNRLRKLVDGCIMKIAAVPELDKLGYGFMGIVVSSIPSILRTETFVNLNIYKGHANELDTTQLISSLDISPSNEH